MAVRNLNGSSDYVQVAAPAYFAGDHTWVGLVKRASTGSYHAPFSIRSVAASPHVTIEFTSGGTLEYVRAQTAGMHAIETTHNWASTAWMLIAITYTSANPDASKFRFHVTEDGSTWAHELMDSADGLVGDAPANWDTAGSPVLDFGRWDASFNYFSGLLGMQALNIGTALSDGQIEALAGGNVADYSSAGFDHLWPFDQASAATTVTDSIGSLDQIGISGTTVVTGNDPATALFDFAAGGGAIKQRVDGAWVEVTRVTRVGGAWV